jgi:phosphatidylglycerophosphate synthase
MIAIGVLMLATPLASGSIFEFALWSGTMAFWAAAVLTALTGLDYFAKAYKRLDTYIGPFLVICRIRAV